MPTEFDIEFASEMVSPQFEDEHTRILELILRAKTPLSARQIRQRYEGQFKEKSKFLADVLAKLSSGGLVFANDRNPNITFYSKPVTAQEALNLRGFKSWSQSGNGRIGTVKTFKRTDFSVNPNWKGYVNLNLGDK